MNTQQQNQKLANLESDIAALLTLFKAQTGMNVYAMSTIQCNDGTYEFITGIEMPEGYEMPESNDDTP